MKRNKILGALLLPLVAAALYQLTASSRSEIEPAPAGGVRAEFRGPSSAVPVPRSEFRVPSGSATGGTGAPLERHHDASAPSAPVNAATNLPALCDSLLRDSESLAELSSVLRRWAETNGPAAAAWAAQLGTRNSELGTPADSVLRDARSELLTQVALGWAGSDLSATLDWAQTLPADTQAAVTVALGYETARTDAVKALSVAASLAPGRERNDLTEHALSQWATTDFTAAVQWVNSEFRVPSSEFPGLRERLLAAVAVALAGQDGASAATLAATALTPGEEQERIAVAVVQRWVQHEPEAAAAWVAQFPDTPARETTVQNLVAFWSAQDRAAAGNWLQTLPEGTLRSAGMAFWNSELGTRNPELATQSPANAAAE